MLSVTAENSKIPSIRRCLQQRQEWGAYPIMNIPKLTKRIAATRTLTGDLDSSPLKATALAKRGHHINIEKDLLQEITAKQPDKPSI